MLSKNMARRKRILKKSKNARDVKEDGEKNREGEQLQEISQFLSHMGFRNINIYFRSLRDLENPPYIEFRFQDEDSEKARNYLRRGCDLKTKINNALKDNYAEILEIKSQKVECSRATYREVLVINPQAKFDALEEQRIRSSSLDSIIKEMRSYRMWK
jgi:hypothetical protein